MASDLDRAFGRMLDLYGADWTLALEVPQGRIAYWEMWASESPSSPEKVLAFAQDHALAWKDYTAIMQTKAGSTVETVRFSVSPSVGQYAKSAAKNWQFLAVFGMILAVPVALVGGGVLLAKKVL